MEIPKVPLFFFLSVFFLVFFARMEEDPFLLPFICMVLFGETRAVATVKLRVIIKNTTQIA